MFRLCKPAVPLAAINNSNSKPVAADPAEIQNNMLRVAALVGLCCLATVRAAPFESGTGLLPLGEHRLLDGSCMSGDEGFSSPTSVIAAAGNLFTTDAGGPYNLTLLSVQQNEVKAAQAARQSYTDADIVDFLTNVECLEGRFDSMGTLVSSWQYYPFDRQESSKA